MFNKKKKDEFLEWLEKKIKKIKRQSIWEEESWQVISSEIKEWNNYLGREDEGNKENKNSLVMTGF